MSDLKEIIKNILDENCPDFWGCPHDCGKCSKHDLLASKIADRVREKLGILTK